MRAKPLLIAGVLLAAALAGTILFAWRRAAHVPTPDRAPQPAPAPAEFVLAAHLRAQHIIAVAAPVQGTVESLLVELGEPVFEGQVLGRIRNTALDAEQQTASADLERVQARQSQFESQVILARADAARARADADRTSADLDRLERAYQRQQMLYREGATPRLVYEKSLRDFEAAQKDRATAAELARGAGERLDAATRNLDTARHTAQEAGATLDRARAAAAAAEVHSPATGLLVGRTRQVGEEVTPDVQDLFQIASDLAALEAVIEPPAPALSLIRAGQEAFITAAGAPDAVAAHVSEVQGNHVLVRFTSPGPALRPGATAQVRIKVR
jgi:multidrug resistance efflux pump